MSETFIVIGAGQAGLQICDSLRKEGFDGRLLLFGDEDLAPYQRPPLSKQFLLGELEKERLPFRPQNFFEKNAIDLKLGVTVSAIDTENKTVLVNDQQFNYDKLAIATGTRVRKLPVTGGDLPGVHYLRTIVDAERIKEHLTKAQSLVAIGGGFIGLEVAAVARKMGLNVTVIEAQGRLMERVVPPIVSDYFDELHRSNDVELLLNSAVSSIAKENDTYIVTLDDGNQIRTDMIVAGIGAIPNTEVAADAGIVCDNGIVVDSFAKTSALDVFAAGDCTMHENAKLKIRHRLESVQNAVDQAKTAAASMVGHGKPYDQVPWFWSDQFDTKLQMVGSSAGAEETVLRGKPEDGAFSVFYFKQELLIGVDSVNQAKDHMMGRKILSKNLRVTSAEVANESLDLKTIITQ